MVRSDPIVEEIHAVREAIAREAKCDIDKVTEAARARQAVEGRESIRLPATKPGSAKRAS